MHGQGAIGQDLPLIGLGASDVNAFHSQLLAAINAAKAYLAGASPTFEGLTELLTQFGDVIETVESTMTADEFAWHFVYKGQSKLASVPIDLGADTSGLGVSLTFNAEVTGFAKIDTGFAVSRTGPAVFTLRPSELTLGVAVDVQDLDAALKVGFLEAAVANGKALLTAFVTVRFVDPTSGDGGLTPSDLGTSLSSLIQIGVPAARSPPRCP